LLAEDNPTIQMLTKRMLEQRGANLVVANNGEEALLKVQEQSFDLILSDIFMPKMNGYKLVESIREQGIQTPVIGLTAATIGEETDKMLAAGANAVLSKPVNIQDLTNLVASFKV
jgi:CheY-like chemotaxis protein